MIPKIILGKGPHATRRTIGYLFGKGRANEHINPHLVASWNDFAPDPGRTPTATRRTWRPSSPRSSTSP